MGGQGYLTTELVSRPPTRTQKAYIHRLYMQTNRAGEYIKAVKLGHTRRVRCGGRKAAVR